MNLRTLVAIVSFFVASSLQAVPLTWHFYGTTGPSDTNNGVPIGEGHAFELQIFLDTDLVGMPSLSGSDVAFLGPFHGQVEIATLGVIPLSFIDVLYFAPASPGGVLGVQFDGPLFRFFINFPSIISTDILHLTAISPAMPSFQSGEFGTAGPNGLHIRSAISLFSATIDCTVCHKRTLTITVPCDSLEYRRHRDHGDLDGPCPANAGSKR